MKALETLGLKAEDFINLAPHEAFYAVADAMDRGAAYKTVIDLMGRSSAELITTMEMGDGVGVFSDEAIAALDDAGDAFDKMKGNLEVFGAKSFLIFNKLAKSLGAYLVLAGKARK